MCAHTNKAYGRLKIPAIFYIIYIILARVKSLNFMHI